MMSLVRWYGFD